MALGPPVEVGVAQLPRSLDLTTRASNSRSSVNRAKAQASTSEQSRLSPPGPRHSWRPEGRVAPAGPAREPSEAPRPIRQRATRSTIVSRRRHPNRPAFASRRPRHLTRPSTGTRRPRTETRSRGSLFDLRRAGIVSSTSPARRSESLPAATSVIIVAPVASASSMRSTVSPKTW